MSKRKSIGKMTADELFRLYEARAQEEKDKGQFKEKIAALKTKKRDMEREHRKALAAVDAEIRALNGGTSRGAGNIAETVVGIISAAGSASTKDIRAALDAKGMGGGNLNQTLAYLKRRGKVVISGRATYTLA